MHTKDNTLAIGEKALRHTIETFPSIKPKVIKFIFYKIKSDQESWKTLCLQALKESRQEQEKFDTVLYDMLVSYASTLCSNDKYILQTQKAIEQAEQQVRKKFEDHKRTVSNQNSTLQDTANKRHEAYPRYC